MVFDFFVVFVFWFDFLFCLQLQYEQRVYYG